MKDRQSVYGFLDAWRVPFVKLNSYSFISPDGQQINRSTAVCHEVNNSGIYVVGNSLDAQQMGASSSDYVAEGMINAWRQSETPISPQWMREQVGLIDRQLLWRGNENRRPMQSTAVALSIIRDSAVWACTGSVRLYHFQNEKIIHAVNGWLPNSSYTEQRKQTAVISNASIKNDEELRFLGSEGNWELIIGSCSIQPKDAFLLCTDGFWKYVTGSEMLIDLLKSETLEEWGTHMLLRLMSRVVPGNDSFSILLIHID